MNEQFKQWATEADIRAAVAAAKAADILAGATPDNPAWISREAEAAHYNRDAAAEREWANRARRAAQG